MLQGTRLAGLVSPAMLASIFWSALAVLVLIPVVAVWRNVFAMAMIVGEGLGGRGSSAPVRLQKRALTGLLQAVATLGLAYWLYVLLPIKTLPGWGLAVIALVAIVVLVIFFNKLIYWHSTWETSVREVLAEDSRAPAEVRAEARIALDRSLEDWDTRLDDCTVPQGASYEGQSLAELAIPARFGCSILDGGKSFKTDCLDAVPPVAGHGWDATAFAASFGLTSVGLASVGLISVGLASIGLTSADVVSANLVPVDLASSPPIIRRIEARISSIEGSCWTFAGCVISDSTSSTPSQALSYTGRCRISRLSTGPISLPRQPV
jgi:hypothetical protein